MACTKRNLSVSFSVSLPQAPDTSHCNGDFSYGKKQSACFSSSLKDLNASEASTPTPAPPPPPPKIKLYFTRFKLGTVELQLDTETREIHLQQNMLSEHRT